MYSNEYQNPSYMNILIVHPFDESTNVLERVYNGCAYDVLHRRNLTRVEVESAIESGSYDRVVLLGHGTPEGLCNMWTGSYVFDRGSYKNKVAPRGIETIATWCNANEFFLKFDEPKDTFSTGMFISEQREARRYFVEEIEDEVIEKQFRLFADVLRVAVTLPIDQVRTYIDENYVGLDPITRFNRENMVMG